MGVVRALIGVGYDPEQEAPGFHFNEFESVLWRLPLIWEAQQGTEADRRALRQSWLREYVNFRKWNLQFWQAQVYRPTVQRKYRGFGATKMTRIDVAKVKVANPELWNRLERGGPTAVYQAAGCTPTECEVLAMLHEGHSPNEVAALRGVSRRAIRNAEASGEAKLRGMPCGAIHREGESNSE